MIIFSALIYSDAEGTKTNVLTLVLTKVVFAQTRLLSGER